MKSNSAFIAVKYIQNRMVLPIFASDSSTAHEADIVYTENHHETFNKSLHINDSHARHDLY